MSIVSTMLKHGDSCLVCDIRRRTREAASYRILDLVDVIASIRQSDGGISPSGGSASDLAAWARRWWDSAQTRGFLTMDRNF